MFYCQFQSIDLFFLFHKKAVMRSVLKKTQKACAKAKSWKCHCAPVFVPVSNLVLIKSQCIYSSSVPFFMVCGPTVSEYFLMWISAVIHTSANKALLCLMQHVRSLFEFIIHHSNYIVLQMCPIPISAPGISDPAGTGVSIINLKYVNKVL